MANDFDQKFRELLVKFLARRNVEAVEVTNWDDECVTYNVGGCPSCAYDEKEYTVDIFYRIAGMEPQRYSEFDRRYIGDGDKLYTYNGNFSDLLKELIEIGDSDEG